MTAKVHFLYVSLSNSLKDDLWLLGAISFTIPPHMIEIGPMTGMGNAPSQFLIKFIEIWHLTAMGNFLYNSLSKSLKYNLCLLWAISFTIPYQNQWNVIPDCYGQFRLQFLIEIIKIWPMTARGHFLYNSLPRSVKYFIWVLGAISFTIPYQTHWNMIPDC